METTTSVYGSAGMTAPTTRISNYLLRPIVLVALLICLVNTSHAQIGVIVLKEGEKIPSRQWYLVENDREENVVYIYDTDDWILELLGKMIEPFDIRLADAYVDAEGDKFYYLTNGNGYVSTVWYLPQANGMSYLQVQTSVYTPAKEE